MNSAADAYKVGIERAARYGRSRGLPTLPNTMVRREMPFLRIQLVAANGSFTPKRSFAVALLNDGFVPQAVSPATCGTQRRSGGGLKVGGGGQRRPTAANGEMAGHAR